MLWSRSFEDRRNQSPVHVGALLQDIQISCDKQEWFPLLAFLACICSRLPGRGRSRGSVPGLPGNRYRGERPDDKGHAIRSFDDHRRHIHSIGHTTDHAGKRAMTGMPLRSDDTGTFDLKNLPIHGDAIIGPGNDDDCRVYGLSFPDNFFKTLM